MFLQDSCPRCNDGHLPMNRGAWLWRIFPSNRRRTLNTVCCSPRAWGCDGVWCCFRAQGELRHLIRDRKITVGYHVFFLIDRIFIVRVRSKQTFFLLLETKSKLCKIAHRLILSETMSRGWLDPPLVKSTESFGCWCKYEGAGFDNFFFDWGISSQEIVDASLVQNTVSPWSYIRTICTYNPCRESSCINERKERCIYIASASSIVAGSPDQMQKSL
ncbi:hypothetical protein BZA77DRAFT_138158 [Pyronema omphalodes]|nr:hypothetical protein BZA77DRAFT_138158 [Pyronema omphalodes]